MKTPYLFFTLLLSFPTFAHQGHIDDAAVLACNDKKVTDYCEYKNQVADRYKGSCRLMLETLMCVRNQPIERANNIFHPLSKALSSTEGDIVIVKHKQ